MNALALRRNYFSWAGAVDFHCISASGACTLGLEPTEFGGGHRVFSFFLKSQRAYRLFLKWRFGVDQPTGAPSCRGHNVALKSADEWKEARAQAKSLGLPPHPDAPKSWDSLIALDCILKRTDRQARVLDAGGQLYSVILPWLFLYGYRNLTGINLAFDRTVKRGPIVYEHGDITQTRFAHNTFDAVACLSVVEHGVDLEAYFREMARVLKPGGVLVTSTDYYATGVDTMGRTAYGTPVRVFSRDEIMAAFEVAGEYDLELTDRVDLACDEKPVHWERFNLDFTFLVFSMEKAGK